MPSNSLLLVLLALSALTVVLAHPIPTFYMMLCDAQGNQLRDQYNGANFTAGVEETLYFTFLDKEHNQAIVSLSQMMPMHQRMIHILLVSQDNELTAHTHPDDFVDMSSLSNSTTVFHISVKFPRAGVYSIAANFMFDDVLNNTYRDGFAQTEFNVAGTPMMDLTPARNYNQTNRYALWNFTDVNREIFKGWVDTTKNYDPNGYWGKLQVAVNGTLLSGPNININELDCAYFVVTMYDNDSTMSKPAPLMPLMAAPVHFTLTNSDGAVYHAHGMYLPQGESFPDAVKSISNVNTMMMDMSNPLFNLSMSASMIGVLSNGSLDCFTDEGQVMYDMDKMAAMMNMPSMAMDMNVFYGPTQYNSMGSIFNWPNSANWRVYAWMKIQDDSGNTRLIVPHWDIWVSNATDSTGLAPNSLDSGAAPILWSLSVLFCTIFLLIL